jgi:hypothetical protein
MGVFMDGCGKVTPAKNGVDVGGNAGKVRVMDCIIIDTVGGGTMANGVNFSANSYDCMAFNNRIKDMTGSRVSYPTSTSWAATTAYALDAIVAANGLLYKCTVAGTSGSTAPSHTSGTATDGTVTWQYRGKIPLNITDFDDNGQLRLPHNLIGGGALTTFDIGAENGKPLRLNRNSTGDVQIMGGTASPVVKLTSSGKVLANAGLGVGNSASATTTGSVTKKMEVFDASGNSLGFVPIYGSIT